MRAKYADHSAVDQAYSDLKAFWDNKLNRLVNTPDEA